MKWEMNDNARSGFHYLVLGLLLIGVPSLFFWGFNTWHSAATRGGDLPLGIFHNGYFIFDGNTTAVADTSRGERLAYASAIAVAMAAAVVVILLLLHVASAWRVGRWIFVVIFIWGLVSALFLPKAAATIMPGGIRISQRASLPGDITIPFTERTTEADWLPTDKLLGRSVPVAGISDVFRMAAYRVRSGDTLLIATTDARKGFFGMLAGSTTADEALNHMDSLLFQR